MKKILFLIPDLSVGGAEKVLVNLVNNLDQSKFDITVQTLFAGGVNEQFLKAGIKLRHCFKRVFRGNSQLLKLLSPKQLYKLFVKEHYDIVVSYLEGTVSRIVSGCHVPNTKLVSWIHVQQETNSKFSYAFRDLNEAKNCYSKFDKIVCVSEYVKSDFKRLSDYIGDLVVLYNTNETNQILELSKHPMSVDFDKEQINICVVGKITKHKGVLRVLNIQKKLIDDGYNTHIYFLGTGPLENDVVRFVEMNKIENKITLLGYNTNPYNYIRSSDMFLCASYGEGFTMTLTDPYTEKLPHDSARIICEYSVLTDMEKELNITELTKKLSGYKENFFFYMVVENGTEIEYTVIYLGDEYITEDIFGLTEEQTELAADLTDSLKLYMEEGEDDGTTD